jgi:hypothetical protein
MHAHFNFLDSISQNPRINYQRNPQGRLIPKNYDKLVSSLSTLQRNYNCCSETLSPLKGKTQKFFDIRVHSGGISQTTREDVEK